MFDKILKITQHIMAKYQFLNMFCFINIFVPGINNIYIHLYTKLIIIYLS